jgi:hypothetical protein
LQSNDQTFKITVSYVKEESEAGAGGETNGTSETAGSLGIEVSE